MSVHYREGLRAVTGSTQYIDDMPVPRGTLYMAIVRSPYPHARIKSIDVSDVIRRGGYAYGPAELSKVIKNPFPVAVKAPLKYYPFAIDKARFVGEPVAVVLSSDQYKAVDLAEMVNVDYEPLEPIVTIDDAIQKKDVLIHESAGSNVVMHRVTKFGDVDAAFKDAPVIVRTETYYHRHLALPLETYGVIAHKRGDEIDITANSQGPMLQVYFISRALSLPTSKIHLSSPRDIGGSFGSKYQIYPYMVLAAAASMLSGKPVKWIESRTESFIASSAGSARKGYIEIAAEKDGKIRGMRMKFYDDEGAYPRPPEPGALFRNHGNLNGPYDVKALEAEYYAVLTNKSPTGLNRAYGSPQFYFVLERGIEELAKELRLDPLEIRYRNLIRDFPVVLNGQRFYETPTGGLYPMQNYSAALELLAREYRRWINEKEKDKYIGIGLATFIEPSVTNLGYVDLAVDPKEREYPHSGAGDYITLTLDSSGVIHVFVNTSNEGLGHETSLSEVIAGELGIDPSMVSVESKIDTSHPWSISSGSYSSRFAPVILSAAVLASRQLKDKLGRLASIMLGTNNVRYEKGVFYDADNPSKKMDIRKIAAAAQWDPGSLPKDVDANLSITVYYQPPTVKAAAGDKINSSAMYAFQAHMAVVRIDPASRDVKLLKYIVIHDSGKMYKKEFVDGQIHGGVFQGIAAALYEELAYGNDGQPMVLTWSDYESPSLGDALWMSTMDVLHMETPLEIFPSKAAGVGEGPMMGSPVAIANAVANALGKPINKLPLHLDDLLDLCGDS
ncbi:MAG: xanthine dehydrogenase family protein molybdopterin-binding subunit [Thermocladium sp.]